MTTPETGPGDTNPTAAEPFEAATAGPGTMRAVVQRAYGPPSALATATVPRPQIAADEVLVHVAAAGVDRGVWHLVTGTPFAVRLAGYGIRAPKQQVPGMDLAGTVVEVGAEVADFAVGDEVYGVGVGTYAEFARAKAAKLAHRPATLPVEHAAALAISGSTASQALFDVGRAEPGQRVLVLGASGGVGSFAVQLAKARGLHVTAVASGAKRDHVLALGADVALDYTVDDFTEQPPFDLIIDAGGRNRLSKLRRALTRDGTLVIVGGEDGGSITGGTGRQLRAMLLSPFVSQRLTSFIAKESADHWAQLRELVERGGVTVPVDRTYGLDEAVEALNDLEAGRVRGKAVILVAPG